MLRRSSRGISTNQGTGFMSDHSTHPPPPAPRCAGPRSPSLFFIKETEPAMTQTSILDHKPAVITSMVDPFFNDKHPCLDPNPFVAARARGHFWEKRDSISKAIGLGIVDALENDRGDVASLKPNSRKVLFGSQLRIQIPNSIPRSGSMDSLKSPVEFGAKNKSSQLALFSPIGRSPMGSTSINVGMGTEMVSSSPRVVTGKLSETELELLNSEDYTCVIFHGPNPKTTHIFDCYMMEDCNKMTNVSMEEENAPVSVCDCLGDQLSLCKNSSNMEKISSVTRTIGATSAKKFN